MSMYKRSNGIVREMASPRQGSTPQPLLEFGDDIEGYAAIHPVAIAQSTVLSSILESSGDTQLPSIVSFPDFRLWQRAVVDRERNAGKCTTDLDVRTVCAVLKVSHQSSAGDLCTI